MEECPFVAFPGLALECEQIYVAELINCFNLDGRRGRPVVFIGVATNLQIQHSKVRGLILSSINLVTTGSITKCCLSNELENVRQKTCVATICVTILFISILGNVGVEVNWYIKQHQLNSLRRARKKIELSVIHVKISQNAVIIKCETHLHVPFRFFYSLPSVLPTNRIESKLNFKSHQKAVAFMLKV